MSEYISREAVEKIIAAQCGECADACLEFDGIQPDCNQCLLYGAKKAIESVPAAEVKKRLDAYEKEKEKGKKVPVNAYISLGDEVKFNADNVTVIVTRLGYNFITGIDKHGSVYTYGLPCNWETTGRHFDLTELFQFMGGGEAT